MPTSKGALNVYGQLVQLKMLKQAYFWNLAKGSNLALTSPPRFNIWNENEVGIF